VHLGRLGHLWGSVCSRVRLVIIDVVGISGPWLVEAVDDSQPELTTLGLFNSEAGNQLMLVIMQKAQDWRGAHDQSRTCSSTDYDPIVAISSMMRMRAGLWKVCSTNAFSASALRTMKAMIPRPVSPAAVVWPSPR
jgi:hypothetical protein